MNLTRIMKLVQEYQRVLTKAKGLRHNCKEFDARDLKEVVSFLLVPASGGAKLVDMGTSPTEPAES